MSNETVEVPFGDVASETATLLLAAAEELDLPADVVQTNSDGAFVVPAEVAEKAKAGGDSDEEKKPAKKAAKKAPAKKTAKKKA